MHPRPFGGLLLSLNPYRGWETQKSHVGVACTGGGTLFDVGIAMFDIACSNTLIFGSYGSLQKHNLMSPAARIFSSHVTVVVDMSHNLAYFLSFYR